MTPQPARAPLALLSVVIPARDESGCIAATVERLQHVLRRHNVPHEIVVVDDGSSDETWAILSDLAAAMPELRPVRNPGPHGFGRAIVRGFDRSRGDAIVVMMADDSDDCHDVVRYWDALNAGWDCVFGSRFMKGGAVVGYPAARLWLNRLANLILRLAFRLPFDDTTNAFKAYRRNVIDGCRPFRSAHFSLTIEIPLKAVVRGFTWTAIPVGWRNRRSGVSKLKLGDMARRYFSIMVAVWWEKQFGRGGYRKAREEG